MLKQERGVTLVALVITIIILLILAGVSIAMLTGENGLLTKANTAKEESAKAEVADRINMEITAIYADVLADNLADFADYDLTQINTNLNGVAEAELDTTDTTNKTLNFTGTTYTGITGKIVITGVGKATPTKAEVE